jgi:hypothetical protein
MFSGKRIRVITIREKEHGCSFLPSKHINASETGFNTGIITIEKNYIFRKPLISLICSVVSEPELATTFSIPDM